MQRQRISLTQATAPTTKSVVTAPRKRISLSAVTENAEIVESVQKFEITATERTFLIKFGSQQFGVVKHDNIARYENLQRNCDSKEQKAIAGVINIMKTYLKAGMSFEQLKERMSRNESLFAPSIKVFTNRINKA
jgi:hypothetical protein